MERQILKKKLISAILVMTLLLGTAAALVFEPVVATTTQPGTGAGSDVTIFVNGNLLYSDVAPVIIDGRTMLPLRAIFEALGALVDWNGNTRTVTAVRGDVTITLTIGQSVLYKNGQAIALDVPAMISNDRTMVPVRAVAESLGANVDWDGSARVVNIDLPNDYYDDAYEYEYDYFIQNIAADFEQRVFELTNAERERHGLAPFIWNDALARAARVHCEDMAESNISGHRGSDGSMPWDRIGREGLQYRTAAENVANGLMTPESVVESLMNSQVHRANILNVNHTHLGVGLYYSESSEWRTYVTQKFASLRNP